MPEEHVMLEELPAEDRYAIEQAIALDGLILDLKEPTQRARLVRVIGRVAEKVRLDMHNGSLDFEDPHNESPGMLAELEMKLSDPYESAPGPPHRVPNMSDIAPWPEPRITALPGAASRRSRHHTGWHGFILWCGLLPSGMGAHRRSGAGAPGEDRVATGLLRIADPEDDGTLRPSWID
jgi:hypothetical protein